MLWSFDRNRDSTNIENKDVKWLGPFSWPSFESVSNLQSIPNIQGVYILTFPFNEGFLLYSAGITNSTKRRFQEHTRDYKKGKYNVLDIDSAKAGIRLERWHGWGYAKSHHDKFLERREEILEGVNKQLGAMSIFVCKIDDLRIRERLEASIMINIYTSKEPWSEVADRGAYLKTRENCEMPIEVYSIHDFVIYGLPNSIEI